MTLPIVLSVIIPGEPFAQPRARSFALMKGPKGARVPVLGPSGAPIVRHYDDKRAVAWKTTAQEHMLTAMTAAGLPTPFVPRGPVHISIDAFFACLKSDVRAKNPRPLRWKATGKDFDNIAKAVTDAAKGVLWLDDAQIASAPIRKLYAPQDAPPRVELRVWALAEEVGPEAQHDLSALQHIAAIVAARPCECSGNCDTCASCLARHTLGIEEPKPQEIADSWPVVRSLFD